MNRKRANHFIYMALVLVIGLLTASCEPDEHIGPQGPQGEQGLQGAQGQEGPAGPQGQEGTANVLYSEWTEFDLNNWSEFFSYFGQIRRIYTINIESVDADIIASGSVLVYVRFAGAFSSIQPLPVIGPITKNSEDQILNYMIQTGEIVLSFHNLTNRDQDPGRIGSGNQYRYIIIPGGTPVFKSNALYLNDYPSVIKLFGIEP